MGHLRLVDFETLAHAELVVYKGSARNLIWHGVKDMKYHPNEVRLQTRLHTEQIVDGQLRIDGDTDRCSKPFELLMRLIWSECEIHQSLIEQKQEMVPSTTFHNDVLR